MGFFDFLFGSGPEVQDPMELGTLLPGQENLLNMLLGQFQQQGGANFLPPGFEGEFTAPLTGDERGILDTLGLRAENLGGATLGPANQNLTSATNTLSGFLQPESRGSILDFLSPALGQGITDLGEFGSLMGALSGGGGGGGFSMPFNSQGFDQAIGDLRGASGGGETKESIAAFLQGLVPTDTGEFENFFRTNIQDPSLQAFQEDILPQIGRSFGGANFFSGERQQADTQAREDLLTSLTRTRGDLEFKNLQDLRNIGLEIGQTATQADVTGQQQMLDALAQILSAETSKTTAGIGANATLGAAAQRAGASKFGSRAQILSQLLDQRFQAGDRNLQARLEALGFADRSAGRSLQATDQLGRLGSFLTEREDNFPRENTRELLDILGAQGLPREIDQLGLDREFEEFTRRQDFQNQRLQLMLAALGIRGMENVVPVTQGREGAAGNIIAGLLSGAGAAGGFGALFSDTRLKKNIKRIGTLLNGLGLYTFHYIWGGAQQVGVMAQEVLKVQPDSVIQHPSGYLMVDYDKLRVQ